KPDMNSPVVAPPPADKVPPPLHVAGNELETPAGRPVWLQGLCVDSLEWSAAGERVVQSVEVAIDDWKANVIRLPVDMKAAYWFGEGPGQHDGGARYRQIVDSVVNAAAARGAYVAIDLHKFRAPQAADLAFWKDVATRYRNHPAVIFELFNEPHDITWSVWRDGGDVTDHVKPKQGVVVENTEKLTTFHAVGMQQLVDTIRATGAKNLIIAGGIDWSFDLSGIMNGFALQDRGGNGIMYSAHVYPWKKDWQDKFLVTAAKYPLFVGEVGAIRAWSDFPFIGPAEQYPLDGWAEDMIGLIQKYQLNWTGFSFNPHCGPKVISDWNYTPTPYWGVYVKEALAGRQFHLKAMR
ncbi:MAG TPA: cellulase family glycosylhydrolase, partial [Opitutaceae bacterium]|nr:cellulase family glycosylhydrolase [Opitutaceae bacterium]